MRILALLVALCCCGAWADDLVARHGKGRGCWIGADEPVSGRAGDLNCSCLLLAFGSGSADPRRCRCTPQRPVGVYFRFCGMMALSICHADRIPADRFPLPKAASPWRVSRSIMMLTRSRGSGPVAGRPRLGGCGSFKFLHVIDDGCRAISRGPNGERVWITSGGKPRKGLANRRDFETAWCLKPVPPVERVNT